MKQPVDFCGAPAVMDDNPHEYYRYITYKAANTPSYWTYKPT